MHAPGLASDLPLMNRSASKKTRTGELRIPSLIKTSTRGSFFIGDVLVAISSDSHAISASEIKKSV